MASRRRNYRPLFLASMITYTGLVIAGVVFALTSEGTLPPIGGGYASGYIEQLIADGEYETAARQMRIAIEIEFFDPDMPGALAQLARENGDRGTELYALRIIADRNNQDPDAHLAVSDALLLQGAPNALREVIGRADFVLTLDPGSTRAHRQLAAAYRGLGDLESAREHEAEASGTPGPAELRP